MLERFQSVWYNYLIYKQLLVNIYFQALHARCVNLYMKYSSHVKACHSARSHCHLQFVIIVFRFVTLSPEVTTTLPQLLQTQHGILLIWPLVLALHFLSCTSLQWLWFSHFWVWANLLQASHYVKKYWLSSKVWK